MNLKILTAATATNSAPTLATDGFDLRTFAPAAGDDFVLALKSTAGSGTMTVTIKIWLYNAVAARWMPAGTDATDADRGKMNEGNAIGEVTTDLLQHTERIEGLRHFDRIYAEITAIGGTATAVDLWLLGR